MGFLDDIRHILEQMPEERQIVFFSARVSPPIKALIKTFTRDPQWVKIEAQEMTVPAIEQIWHERSRRVASFSAHVA